MGGWGVWWSNADLLPGLHVRAYVCSLIDGVNSHAKRELHWELKSLSKSPMGDNIYRGLQTH